MTLAITGSGFGRTGTMALKRALEELGFGPCHHMQEVLAHPEQVAHWQAIAAGRPVKWDEVFAGYRSQVDWPGAHVSRETAAAYFVLSGPTHRECTLPQTPIFRKELLAIVSLGLSVVPPPSADVTIREDGVVTQSGVGAESCKCGGRWNIMSTYKLSRELVVLHNRQVVKT